MKKLFCVILFFFFLASLYSQNRKTMDDAITAFAKDFTSQFPNTGSIAVVAFKTDIPVLLIPFIETMQVNIQNAGRTIEILERAEIDIIIKEINFALTVYVTNQKGQAPWIGHLKGAEMVIYGSLERESMGIKHKITIKAAEAETGVIKFIKFYEVQIENNPHFWTVGISVGTSFHEPLVIGTLFATIAPFRSSFLGIGVDVGIISNNSGVDNYYSVSPFAYYAFFKSFNKGGWYAGAGVSYWYYDYERTPANKEPERYILAYPIIGINIGDMLDISFSIRTDFIFENVSNKFSVGYTYRFA
ncbi:MAG: hypothetical protein LBH44_04670 [Treponema sp.]|jgi:hypothetical protein|nr:hypothetical protein [Treponema sp.]